MPPAMHCQSNNQWCSSPCAAPRMPLFVVVVELLPAPLVCCFNIDPMLRRMDGFEVVPVTETGTPLLAAVCMKLSAMPPMLLITVFTAPPTPLLVLSFAFN